MVKGRIDNSINIEDNYFPDKFWKDLKKFTKENLKRTKIVQKKRQMHKPNEKPIK